MPDSLFITGASGFIGRHFLERVDSKKFKAIYCLSRRTPPATQPPVSSNVHVIQGGLYDADVYAPYLRASDVVIHLAAVTGKAPVQEYFATNVAGTKFLIEQCQRWGVSHFLYMSSIAVTYPNVAHYYYAQSKRQAEEVMRSSGLHYIIIRPTIVLGQDAPAWKNLSQLARAPILPLCGDGRTKIQPIHVDDLADVVWSLTCEGNFPNDTFDIGGPGIVTIEEFLRQIARVCYRRTTRVIHIPSSLLVPMLTYTEKFLYSFMPFNIGQFSVFLYDSTIENNWVFEKYKGKMQDINQILEVMAIHEYK